MLFGKPDLADATASTLTVLSKLEPEDRVVYIQDIVEKAILLTPTGPVRNALTEANILLMCQMERQAA